MALSGKTSVTTAGAAVTLGSELVQAALMVKALASNSGKIYLGNNGSNDVDSASGLELSAADSVVFEYVSHLADLYLDASVDGEGVTWLILSA